MLIALNYLFTKIPSQKPGPQIQRSNARFLIGRLKCDQNFINPRSCYKIIFDPLQEIRPLLKLLYILSFERRDCRYHNICEVGVLR